MKVAFDQTVWSAVWNSIYYTVLGLLRFESPVNIFNELKATFWPMLTVSTSLNFYLSLPPGPCIRKATCIDMTTFNDLVVLVLKSARRTEAHRLLKHEAQGARRRRTHHGCEAHFY